MKNISIQLYSVREKLEEDYKGTLKALSDMGYEGIEFAGNYGGYTGKELNEMLTFYGLVPVAAHISVEQMEKNSDFHFDILDDTECRTIISPYLSEEEIANSEDTAERLAAIAEKCALKGYNFGFHNHLNEFNRDENGNIYYDILMNLCGPLVLTELDLGWIKHAELDPEDFIRKYAGRINYIHLRQFKKTKEDWSDAVLLENGDVDIEKCSAVARIMGCEHFIVEQGSVVTDELSDARANIEYLKALKVD